MFLDKLSMVNFKNYKEARGRFSKEINCFVGKNGSGKTNLLDAIYYLSITKSALTPQDNQCFRHDESVFSVRGEFELEGRKRVVVCGMELGKKKLVKLEDKAYRKASEHIGKFPVVLIAPNDTDVIRGSSDYRRKFFDAIISQTDQKYLQTLISYNHVLKQRNSLLRQFSDRDFIDDDLLTQYDQQIMELGSAVYKNRKKFIKGFQPTISRHYQNLSEKSEKVDLGYESHFDLDIQTLLLESRQKDIILKRTSVGVHKDEFHFLMDGKLIRKFGSQGQQKSYLIALKLGQFDFIQKERGFKPLLLLDDIFDKLDDFRMTKLMEMVASDAFGQIFVTDARPERTLSVFENIDHEVKVFEVEDGAIKELP